MTQPGYTALVFVIDRSGSMMSIHQEVEGSLKAMVKEEASHPGKITVDTVFFDDRYEERSVFASPEDVDFTIEPRGMTALYDAVGKKITSFGQALAQLPEAERPEKVLFIIATDGLENNSKEHSSAVIARMIDEQKTKYSWQFTFLGANQDAVLTAAKLNISQNDAITFQADASGVTGVVSALSSYTRSFRAGSVPMYSDKDRSAARGH